MAELAGAFLGSAWQGQLSTILDDLVDRRTARRENGAAFSTARLILPADRASYDLLRDALAQYHVTIHAAEGSRQLQSLSMDDSTHCRHERARVAC